jgi:hypothetical protein
MKFPQKTDTPYEITDIFVVKSSVVDVPRNLPAFGNAHGHKRGVDPRIVGLALDHGFTPAVDENFGTETGKAENVLAPVEFKGQDRIRQAFLKGLQIQHLFFVAVEHVANGEINEVQVTLMEDSACCLDDIFTHAHFTPSIAKLWNAMPVLSVLSPEGSRSGSSRLKIPLPVFPHVVMQFIELL